VTGAFEAGHFYMGAVFMVSSLLSIGYLMPIVVRAFFRPLPEGEEEGLKEAPLLMLLPICTTALACFVIFFYTDAVYRLLAPAMGMAE
jgi:multicomponent Na+:H+ antiporter subunit D